MSPNPFLDGARRLRSGWWIGIFFAVLASLLLPLILLARESGTDVSPVEQLAVVLVASLICQALRREPRVPAHGAARRALASGAPPGRPVEARS